MQSSQTDAGRGPYREIITVRVTKDVRARLIRQAQAQGVPLADLARQALEARASEAAAAA